MRAIFLLGGFIGFLAVALSEAQAGMSGHRILLDSAIGCLIGAVLLRFFWGVLVQGLTHTVNEKRAARRAAEEAAAAKPASTPVKSR